MVPLSTHFQYRIPGLPPWHEDKAPGDARDGEPVHLILSGFSSSKDHCNGLVVIYVRMR